MTSGARWAWTSLGTEPFAVAPPSDPTKPNVSRCTGRTRQGKLMHQMHLNQRRHRCRPRTGQAHHMHAVHPWLAARTCALSADWIETSRSKPTNSLYP